MYMIKSSTILLLSVIFSMQLFMQELGYLFSWVDLSAYIWNESWRV